MALLIYLASLLGFGLVAGFVARALMPGDQKMGCLATSLLGIGGSYMGGYLASWVYHQRQHEFTATGLVGSVLGAMALLIVFGVLRRIF